MRKTSAILFGLKLLKFPIAILSYIIVAKYFGVSYEKDVWLLVFATITTIDIGVWGPVNDIFRAKFISIKESEGEVIALHKTRSLLFFMFIGSLLLVTLIEIFPNTISTLIASSYTGKQKILLIKMLRYAAPILLINQATLICSSILNAYNSFYAPEISSFISQIVNIGIVVLLSSYIGIYSLLVSNFIALLILTLLLLFYFKKNKINLFTGFKPNFNDFLIYFTFALPLFLPYFIGQLNGLVEKRLVSGVGIGAVSIIDFSRKFPDIFNMLLTSVVLTVLVPTLSAAYYRKNINDFNNIFTENYRLILLGLGFFFIVMFSGSKELMFIFYGNSSIDRISIEKIANLNILYSLSLFPVFTYISFGMVLISIGKTKINAIIGSITQIIVIVLNVFLVGKIGIKLFPISLLVSHAIMGLFMAYFYPYSKKEIIKSSIRYYLFLIACISVIYLIKRYFLFIKGFNNYKYLAFIIFADLIVFISLGFLFKIQEMFLVKNIILTKCQNYNKK